MPMPQYNGPVYAQGPTAVGPYNLQGYQPTFGYNPQQTYMPQDGRRDHVEGRHSRAAQAHQGESHQVVDHVDRLMRR